MVNVDEVDEDGGGKVLRQDERTILDEEEELVGGDEEQSLRCWRESKRMKPKSLEEVENDFE